MTGYVVLRRDESSDHVESWQLVAGETAVSADAAIRQVAEREGAGEYVATPARSWNPKKVTVETKTAVKLA